MRVAQIVLRRFVHQRLEQVSDEYGLHKHFSVMHLGFSIDYGGRISIEMDDNILQFFWCVFNGLF